MNGANLVLKATLCPAARVMGNARPEIVKSESVLATDEIVTAAPVADNVLDIVADAPAFTLPKLYVAGETLSCPAVAADPESESVAVLTDPLTLWLLLLFQSSLTIDTLPLSVPAAVGPKRMLKVVLWPAERISG